MTIADEKRKAAIWQWIAGALAALMTAGIIAQFGFFANLITKAEAKDMINNYAPYTKDKAVIMDYMQRQDRGLKEIRERLRRIEIKVK